MKPWSQLGAVIVSALLAPAGLAQIVLDGSLGPAQTLSGSSVEITEAMGTRANGNLFHSFSQFGVAAGQTATFSGAASIENVVARVTGGSASNIDGTLRSSIASANLYLLNPAGVFFGAGAAIDISGSLHISSAQALRFDDGATFFVDPASASTLSVAAPSAFGFLSGSSGAVTVDRSGLLGAPGKQISLVGGDVLVRGTPAGGSTDPANLTVAGGRVLLAAVRSATDVPLTQAATPELGGAESLANVSVTEAAAIDVSAADGTGQIMIVGGQIEVRDAVLTANNLGTNPSTNPAVDLLARGDVTLSAALVSADAFAVGNAGDIQLSANNLTMDTAAQLSSSTFGSGASGKVSVQVNQVLSLAGAAPGGNPTAILTNTFSTGNASLVQVAANRIDMRDGAQIGSGAFATGNSGGVSVQASDEIKLTGTAPFSCPATNGCSTVIDANTFGNFAGAGAAGAITVEAPRVTLIDGGTISSTTVGSGQGGSVTVRAADTVSLTGAAVPAVGIGASFFDVSPSAIVAVSTGAGDAGTIVIDAGNVRLRGGGAISSTSLGGGQGGSVAVTANDTVEVSGRAPDGTPSTIGASALDLVGVTANAGELILTMPRLLITDGARVDTLSRGSGQGGNIRIDSSDRVLIFDSSLSTQAFSNGAGGNITLNTVNLLHLVNGEISTSVAGGVGSGGNIDIDPLFVVLANGRIAANAFGGTGGNINIVAGSFFANAGSNVDASSQLGIQGSIEIDSPDTNVSEDLAALPAEYQDAGDLLGNTCAQRRGGSSSALLVSGKGGQPQHPDSYLLAGSLALLKPMNAADLVTSADTTLPHSAGTRRRELDTIAFNCK